MITSEFEGRILQSQGQPARVPVHVILSHDPDGDPLAVQMTFSGGTMEDVVVWTFSLDLLQEGSTAREKIGEGDVKMRLATGGRALIVCLTSPEGHADVGVPAGKVHSFLRSVQEASGDCSVRLDEELDLFIEEVLGT